MQMEILPAIDLRDGKVVRLARGDYDRQTTYADDPAAVAGQFAAAGARWIHMVDLDAAKSGRPTNTQSVRDVLRTVDLRVELGGGARNDAAVEAMLDLGVSRVVVGSAALADWEWFERLVHRDGLAGRIALGLDAREGLLAVHGWTQQSTVRAEELAGRVRSWPLGAIVYTDIARDGMLSGVNVEATGRIVQATDVPVIASGGVASLADVAACKQAGCAGVIVGKAWYEGRIDLAEACRMAAG
ncbi:MAG: 1-(5-phosphoribosyl)-5-((5-phosphoribosylamino)methylideneamino) imidazole-4-carboxamide isomerase [Planctomycetes bacterium ADurb.Bin126]|nr:MAG: 1-(5-phosphoribosyl)-5-((5-phosphoribosylamino)methylideneamino) imidazole-4-carboxamide isomerase [Planctomycetes bacterium ADurb.Bin126]